MRKVALLIGQVGIASTLAAGMLTATSGAAEAAVANCLGERNRLISAQYVVSNWGERVGSIQLCRAADNRFFGLLIMYRPVPAGKWANAILDNRRADGTTSVITTCDHTLGGGSGHIVPTETWCNTAYAHPCNVSPFCYPFDQAHYIRARGHVYEKDHYGNWEATARGVTAWVRR